MALECLLHESSLDALAAAVNQPNLSQAGLVCRRHVLLHDGHDIARSEGMEIDRVFNRNSHGEPRRTTWPPRPSLVQLFRTRARVHVAVSAHFPVAPSCFRQ